MAHVASQFFTLSYFCSFFFLFSPCSSERCTPSFCKRLLSCRYSNYVSWCRKCNTNRRVEIVLLIFGLNRLKEGRLIRGGQYAFFYMRKTAQTKRGKKGHFNVIRTVGYTDNVIGEQISEVVLSDAGCHARYTCVGNSMSSAVDWFQIQDASFAPWIIWLESDILEVALISFRAENVEFFPRNEGEIVRFFSLSVDTSLPARLTAFHLSINSYVHFLENSFAPFYVRMYTFLC